MTTDYALRFHRLLKALHLPTELRMQVMLWEWRWRLRKASGPELGAWVIEARRVLAEGRFS